MPNEKRDKNWFLCDTALIEKKLRVSQSKQTPVNSYLALSSYDFFPYLHPQCILSPSLNGFYANFQRILIIISISLHANHLSELICIMSCDCHHFFFIFFFHTDSKPITSQLLHKNRMQKKEK